jgi:hypothetical protein
MSKEGWIRRAGPAAMLGGALYLCAFGAAYLIYGVFEEQAKGTFFGQHAFIHMVDAPMFALLALGAVGVFLRQKNRLGKAGFFLTFVGFGLSVVGGLTIVVVGLAVSDEATLGILDVLAHPAAHVLYAVGSLLFGIATYRAGVLPRGGALLMAVGPIWLFASFVAGLGQTVLPIVVPVAVTALGWMWLGYALFVETRAPSAEPASAVR